MPSFGRCFEKLHTEFLCESLSLLSADNFLFMHVSFVSDEYLLHILASVQLDLSHPIAHIVEGILTCAVVCQDYTHCAFIIGLSDSAETFLPGCVPNLELHVLSIDLDRLYLEIDTYNL